MEVESREFEAFVSDLAKRVPEEVLPDTLKVIAFDFERTVMLRNPVDTGRSRAAWSLFFDRHPEFASPPNDGPGVREGKSEGEYREDLKGGNQFIEITNGVPYIVPLEYGHSSQAPAGMVRVAMRVASRNMENRTRKQLEDAIHEADIAANRYRGR